jgi:anti-sigma regulatory factor (Ser/Thr protein kinase)
MPTPASAPSIATATATYPGKPESIRQVRADLRHVLDNCPAADDVVLCASELAANAAVHSDSGNPGCSFTVRARIHPDALVLIEVEDDGGPWNELPPDPVRGRGLDIVRALAAAYGVRATATGRCVWACVTWSNA